MTTSITIGKANIYNMDCMELLKATPDKFYDLSIVDPPYGIGVNQMNMGGRNTVKPTSKNWDNSIPNQEYFNELSRVSKKQIIWGGNYFNLPPSQYFAIWDKGETMYGRDFAEMEYAWCSAGGTRILKLNPNQPERFHPTQKPIKLYEWLLTNYAKQGDKILDTHLGSGSHAIACNNLGFEITACELDPDYFQASIKRIEQASKQTSLFAPSENVKPAQEALL
jgi:site-specific DNA-methyltransferase (adenine-specific)